MKRKISFILAVIMLVSLFTGAVSAARVDEIPAGVLPGGKTLADPVYTWDITDATKNAANEFVSPRGAWQGGGVINFDSSTGHDAAGSLKLEGNKNVADTDPTYTAGGENYLCLWSGIGTTGSYLISFYAKASTPAGIAVQIDNGGAQAAQWTSVGTDWTLVTCLFNPEAGPANAASGYQINIYSVTGENVIAWIDDIQIAEVITDPNYALTDYSAAANTEDGGFALLTPSGAGDSTQYGAWYYRTVPFEAAKYEVKADVKVNTEGINFMVDVEGGSGSQSLNPTNVDEWQTLTATLDVTADGDIRFYVNETDGTVGQVALKNITVTKEGASEPAISWTGETKDGDFIGQCSYIAKKAEAPKLTNILELETVKSRDYMLFENSASAPNAGYYMRAKLNKGEEYTLTFDVLSNNSDVEILTDLEFPSTVTGVSTQGGKVSAVDKWETVSYKFTTNAKWEECDLGDGQTAIHGWPLRIYTAGAMDAQTAIDNIVVKDSKGNVVLSQDFKESTLGDIPTWGIGKYTHIPLGFVPEQEGEVLGYNEIVNGDFEDSSLMSYWWARTDWNGGSWKAEAGKGYDGSVGMVAYGKGAGAADQNNGCFYTLYGEGKEATLDLIEGKTYVLKYKVFRPEGVDSYTYIDINEGQVTNGTATANGEWETVTARFVAPAGALKIRMVVNALAEGEYVVFDDIEIRQVGGDPNGNPKTADNMVLGAVVAVMVLSVAGIAIVSKKRVLSK